MVSRMEFRTGLTWAAMVIVIFRLGVTQAAKDRGQEHRKIGVFDNVECPSYRVVHEGAGFEVRQYAPATWMSTGALSSLSFETATLCGFRPLFQYIQGANLNWTRIAMTAPVVTSVVPSIGPFLSSAFVVNFFIPKAFAYNPPMPLPELLLNATRWATPRCIVVRRFAGFASDQNVASQALKLADSLAGTEWEPIVNLVHRKGEAAYSIAQFNPPFQIFRRTNEVWVEFPGAVNADGEHGDCLPDVEPSPSPEPSVSPVAAIDDSLNFAELLTAA